MNIRNLSLFHRRAVFLLSYHITLYLSCEWLSSVWHFGSHRGVRVGGVEMASVYYAFTQAPIKELMDAYCKIIITL